MRVVMLCATNRGYRVAERPFTLGAAYDFTDFSFRDTAWESPNLDDTRKLTVANGHQFFVAQNVMGAAFLLKQPSKTLGERMR